MTIQIYGARLYVGTSGLKRCSVRIYVFGWSESMLISERIFKLIKEKKQYTNEGLEKRHINEILKQLDKKYFFVD